MWRLQRNRHSHKDFVDVLTPDNPHDIFQKTTLRGKIQKRVQSKKEIDVNPYLAEQCGKVPILILFDVIMHRVHSGSGHYLVITRETMLFIGKPMGRSIVITSGSGHYLVITKRDD